MCNQWRIDAGCNPSAEKLKCNARVEFQTIQIITSNIVWQCTCMKWTSVNVFWAFNSVHSPCIRSIQSDTHSPTSSVYGWNEFEKRTHAQCTKLHTHIYFAGVRKNWTDTQTRTHILYAYIHTFKYTTIETKSIAEKNKHTHAHAHKT